MPSYVVSYDLKRPGQNYDELIEYLKSHGTYWHHLGSTWVIVTDLTAAALRDEIKEFADENDKVLVVESASAGAWTGFSEKGSKWLKDNL